MFRRIFITMISAFSALAPAYAEPLTLDQISRYLNSLVTVETRFSQFDMTGGQADGMLFIHRPGRMRFEYDPPNEALVLASANAVAIFDAKSNAPPQQFPLKRTPLNLILGRNIDLSTAAMVASHGEAEDGSTVIVLRDAKNADAGTIELVFGADPIALRQWIVTDEVGGQTAVVLENLEDGRVHPLDFFSIHREKARRGF